MVIGVVVVVLVVVVVVVVVEVVVVVVVEGSMHTQSDNLNFSNFENRDVLFTTLTLRTSGNVSTFIFSSLCTD